jgi:hypothetical protein
MKRLPDDARRIYHQFSHALIICAGKFDDNERFCDLPTARDGHLMLETLIKHCHMDKRNVTAVFDETCDDVRSVMKEFIPSCIFGGPVFIYFSSHGFFRSNGRWALALEETSSDDACITIEEIHSFIDALKSIPRSRVFVVLDACFSGNILKCGHLSAEAFKDLLHGEGVFLLASSRLNQAAECFAHASVFTWHLCDGLSGKASGKNGYVTVRKLLKFLMKSLQSTPRLLLVYSKVNFLEEECNWVLAVYKEPVFQKAPRSPSLPFLQAVLRGQFASPFAFKSELDAEVLRGISVLDLSLQAWTSAKSTEERQNVLFITQCLVKYYEAIEGETLTQFLLQIFSLIESESDGDGPAIIGECLLHTPWALSLPILSRIYAIFRDVLNPYDALDRVAYEAARSGIDEIICDHMDF